ncbi:hypothetical protein EYF80_028439 [Liparis tanakae]|uniref:Uncharacterized protein n=1 Tax=Liparis tanakae TaxID=230148 RepID=A0A4Z2H972_9TELE|nr:hypothetical protein EYF80_028439 [Liparis tanakae]
MATSGPSPYLSSVQRRHIQQQDIIPLLLTRGHLPGCSPGRDLQTPKNSSNSLFWLRLPASSELVHWNGGIGSTYSRCKKVVRAESIFVLKRVEGISSVLKNEVRVPVEAFMEVICFTHIAAKRHQPCRETTQHTNPTEVFCERQLMGHTSVPGSILPIKEFHTPGLVPPAQPTVFSGALAGNVWIGDAKLPGKPVKLLDLHSKDVKEHFSSMLLSLRVASPLAVTRSK